MKRFETLKKAISHFLLEKGFNRENTQAWLNTPSPDLAGRTPKQLMNPRSISTLYKHAKKTLA